MTQKINGMIFKFLLNTKIKCNFQSPKLNMLSAQSTSSFKNTLIALIKLKRRHIIIDFTFFFKATHLVITVETFFLFKFPSIEVCIITK